MPPNDIPATVRCGRQLRQSRQRVVEAALVTCEQRDAETPGQACTVPLRRCQPTAGSNCAASRRAGTADAACECCTETRQAETSAKPAMRGERLMFDSTFEAVGSVPTVFQLRPGLVTDAWASGRECPLTLGPAH